MAEDNIKSVKLLSKGKRDYGSNYEEHLFEQYKMYVEGMEKTSDRRQNANNYFVTINAALVSLLGIILSTNYFENKKLLGLALSILGLLISIVFWFLIRAYKQLNTGKFTVIHEIEKQLPLALYAHEWDVLGKGEDPKEYFPFSHIELLIPIILGIGYLVLAYIFYCK